MNRKVRRALLTFSGVFFLVVAPVVALYAIGFRFTSPTEDAVPVGVLLVDSEPDNANVFINGKSVGRTSKAVPGLPVGPVTVRLEKEGYSSWEKTLPILPIRATEARTVRLFAENPNVEALAENIQTFNLSPNRRIVAAFDTSNMLHFLDVQGVSIQKPIQLQRRPEEILWSPDSSSILLKNRNTYSLVTLGSTVEIVDLPELAGVDSVVWDPRLPGRLLGIRPGNDLVSYSTASEAVQLLVEDIDRFVPTTRDLIVVTNGNVVTWYSVLGNSDRTQTFTSDITNMLATPAGMLALAHEDGSVQVITRDNEVFPITSGGSKLVGWSPDGTTLLLQSGMSELAIFNVDNERAVHMPLRQLHTIVRLSRPINYPQWFAGGTHVIFQQDDEIILFETDTRDHPIQFTVDSTNTGDAQVVVGEDGYVLLYIKVNEGQATLVSRPLVLPADQ